MAKTKFYGSCPVWCSGEHAQNAHYRGHESRVMRPLDGVSVWVSWSEPLTAPARYLGGDSPRIRLLVGSASVSLSRWQTAGMAKVFDALDRRDMGDVLRSMLELAGGGAK